MLAKKEFNGFLNRDRDNRPIVVCWIILISVLSLHGCAQEKQNAESRKLRYTVSKSTTFYTSPLTHDDHVDYRQILNQSRREELSHKNNIAVDLLEILGLPHYFDETQRKNLASEMGIKRIENQKQCFQSLSEFLYNQKENLNRPPEWEQSILGSFWTKEQFPVANEWLTYNEDYLNRFSEISQKKKFYFFPLIHSSKQMHVEVDSVLTFSERFRPFEQAFQARVMNQMGEGNVEQAIDDLEALLRVGEIRSLLTIGDGLTLLGSDRVSVRFRKMLPSFSARQSPDFH